MNRISALLALGLALPLTCMAMENGVAVITSAGATGIQTGTEIRRDLLGECIVKLPTESQLAPVSTSTDKFVRNVDGATSEGYATFWTSTIEIGWQVRQRYLYVVSTKGVGTTAASQFHQDTAQVFQSERVESDPSQSTHYFGTTSRTRFFSTAQEAEASARKIASARLHALQANLCPDR